MLELKTTLSSGEQRQESPFVRLLISRLKVQVPPRSPFQVKHLAATGTGPESTAVVDFCGYSVRILHLPPDRQGFHGFPLRCHPDSGVTSITARLMCPFSASMMPSGTPPLSAQVKPAISSERIPVSSATLRNVPSVCELFGDFWLITAAKGALIRLRMREPSPRPCALPVPCSPCAPMGKVSSHEV